MVGRLTLDQVVGVRVPAPQLQNASSERQRARLITRKRELDAFLEATPAALTLFREKAVSCETKADRKAVLDAHKVAEAQRPNGRS